MAARRALSGDDGAVGEAAHGEQGARARGDGPEAHDLGARLVRTVPPQHRTDALRGPIRRGRCKVQPGDVDPLR
eukprot:6201806-Pleurochrysis_carterae.AAC.1